MPLSVAQLLKASTEDQVLRFFLDTLESVGLKTTSWQSGSVQRNFLTAVARNAASGTSVVQQIVSNFLVTPKGDWLDLVGEFRFGLKRLAAVICERSITLVSASSAPNHSITAGSILVTTSGASVRFKVVGGPYALNTGLTITVVVKGEFAGADWNVPSTRTVAFQEPMYTGVTASFSGDPTVPGVNAESDERYWARCQLRWAEMTFSVGLRAYELWALTAAPSVKRVRALNNYPFENAITVALDPGIASEVTQVANYVSARNPPNDIVTVQAASVVSQAIVYTPRVASGTTVEQMNAAIQAALDVLPIGGNEIQGAIAGRLLRDTIVNSILCSSTLGVKSVGLQTPTADIILGATDIIQGAFTVSPEFVY